MHADITLSAKISTSLPRKHEVAWKIAWLPKKATVGMQKCSALNVADTQMLFII